MQAPKTDIVIESGRVVVSRQQQPTSRRVAHSRTNLTGAHVLQLIHPQPLILQLHQQLSGQERRDDLGAGEESGTRRQRA